MQFFGTGCLAVVIVVLIQVALASLEKPYDLHFVWEHKIIISKSVWVMSIGTVGMTVYLNFHYKIGSLPELILLVILLWGLAVLSVTDFKKKIIPNPFLKLMIAVWIVFVGVYCFIDIEMGLFLLIQSGLGFLISGLLFFMCYLLSKRQLGAGDVKLAMVMGLYLGGEKALNAFLFGTVLCCLYSLVQVVRKKLSWKDGVPMTPFLTLGTWVVLIVISY